MGFVACLLCNKLSKNIHLELSEQPVLNSNNILQKNILTYQKSMFYQSKKLAED